MVDIEFAPTMKFTGRKTEWTQFAKCHDCGEKFVGRGRTERAAHADVIHWAQIHAGQHEEEEEEEVTA